MAQLWHDGKGQGDADILLTNVKPERWVLNGAQGLVWADDLLMSKGGPAAIAARLLQLEAESN